MVVMLTMQLQAQVQIDMLVGEVVVLLLLEVMQLDPQDKVELEVLEHQIQF